MEFRNKKVENCFAQARTYEYEIPVTGRELLLLLEGFQVRENHRFRRPVFSAKKGALELKGLLGANRIKINYTAEGWEEEKKQMEDWLKEQKLEVLGETLSVCPQCLKTIKAYRVVKDDGVYLIKICPEHGRFQVLIWEGSRNSYENWGKNIQPADQVPLTKPVERGCPLDCGLCEKHERKGCCVLLEVTKRCNLGCPVCFASAGDDTNGDPSLEQIGKQMDYLMSHGGPFNLQLSGGEPTVREDLEAIICMGKEKGFSFFQLNTNGIRLAQEEGYAEKLKAAGLSCVFLQFDSLRDEVYEILRGRRLLKEKLRAIDACEKAGLGIVLVPVLAPGVNEQDLGELVRFAKSRMPVIRGIHIQPLSYFGRCIEDKEGYRITIPRVLRLLEEQTGGEMKAEHFTGGNATNPYCTFQSNYFKQEDGRLQPMVHGTARATATSAQAREAVARQWSGCCCEKSKEETGGCCGEQTGQFTLDTSSFDAFLENIHKNTLAISGMVFQDSYTLDLERLRRCYILETDSRYGMVPFCAYNLTAEDERSLYR